MKLRITSKYASVHNEAYVENKKGELVYSALTDPLSSPLKTRVVDANGNEVAYFTTVFGDAEKRAHKIVVDDGSEDGVKLSLTRKFRTKTKTSESLLNVKPVDWVVVTRRAWTSRFEVRTSSQRVLARAKQVPADLKDVYDLDILDEAHAVQIMVLSLITSAVMHEDVHVTL